jgi:large subunit ribosomal protein L23
MYTNSLQLTHNSPKFTVALVRTSSLSPYHARFLVPLDFSKYDLRDYLYHAYNVKCFNIRSIVKQMPVRDTREQPRHWFRPESKKYMTVEMEQPFVWPQVPDLEPWGQKERADEIEESSKATGNPDQKDARAAAAKLRDQAQKLLYKTVPKTDFEIKRKKAQKMDLTEEEQEAEQIRLAEKKEVSRMSRTKFWEKERSDKVVQSDGNGYAIKA